MNVREINAFALPGGPMFINRGMMEKAHSEGEIAGVMAHELSHVALRHGTAQATKASPYAMGQIAGADARRHRRRPNRIGDRAGHAIRRRHRFLRFSREYQRQADILGTHIMARAGYDPRDMANVFRTIEQESGPGGPQWMSDHPNPGNRYDYINQEAAQLRVENSRASDTARFQNVQAHLRSMPPAPSTEEATRTGAGRTSSSSGGASNRRPSGGHIERPAENYTDYDEGNLFRVSVPSNWQEVSGNNAVTFAPSGAYGTVDGQSVFTHGVEIGVARNETHELRTATDELIQSLAQSNPRLSRPSRYERTTIGGLEGTRTLLSNVSDVTGGEERIFVYTTLLGDGTLFYLLGVAPRAEFSDYETAFRNIAASVQFVR